MLSRLDHAILSRLLPRMCVASGRADLLLLLLDVRASRDFARLLLPFLPVSSLACESDCSFLLLVSSLPCRSNDVEGERGRESDI